MSSESTEGHLSGVAPIPRTFREYVKSFGPGLVVVLTWLGAGDLVDSAMAGSSYGYALMWALALSLLLRFFIVNIVAKYQLCNQHGETVMAGFRRIHVGIPIFMGVVTLVFGHFYCSYMIKGVGEATHHLLNGFGCPMTWSVLWLVIAGFFVFGSAFKRIQKLFYFFLAILSVTLIGTAIWSGPNPLAVGKGIFMFNVPEQTKGFAPLLIVISLIGAVTGSINNLMYPYFIQQKGWMGPKYRKVQLYDLLFGILIIIVLDLSVWIVGAEILHPENIAIENLDDLARMLVLSIGRIGAPILYLGVVAAVFTSLIGSAVAYGYMCHDIVQKVRPGGEIPIKRENVRKTRTFRLVALWCFVSPLFWSIPNMPGFVTLTVVVNAAAVVVFPVLSIALWIITSKSSYIGPKYKNKWWENTMILLLFVIGVYATYKTIISIAGMIKGTRG